MELGMGVGTPDASPFDLDAIAAKGADPSWQIQDQFSGVRTLFFHMFLGPVNMVGRLEVGTSARKLTSRRDSQPNADPADKSRESLRTLTKTTLVKSQEMLSSK